MPENVTQEDLLKLKIELTDADTKDRHEIKNLIQEHSYNVNELKDNLNLTQQSQKSMEQDVTEIKQDIKEVKAMFLKLPEQFATKQEHKQNVEKIWFLVKIIWTVWLAIILWMWGFIWSLISELIKNG